MFLTALLAVSAVRVFHLPVRAFVSCQLHSGKFTSTTVTSGVGCTPIDALLDADRRDLLFMFEGTRNMEGLGVKYPHEVERIVILNVFTK